MDVPASSSLRDTLLTFAPNFEKLVVKVTRDEQGQQLRIVNSLQKLFSFGECCATTLPPLRRPNISERTGSLWRERKKSSIIFLPPRGGAV